MSLISHEDYLTNVLNSKKMELQELNIQQRVSIAKYETERELLESQIRSIERQLEGGK